MIDFDVDKIREEIKDLSYKDKLELLEEKGNDMKNSSRNFKVMFQKSHHLQMRFEQNKTIVFAKTFFCH